MSLRGFSPLQLNQLAAFHVCRVLLVNCDSLLSTATFRVRHEDISLLLPFSPHLDSSSRILNNCNEVFVVVVVGVVLLHVI